MAETKIKLRFFTIPQWEKEADWLRSMHQQGWKLTGITGPCLYKFARCTPEDVMYQLDFNPEGVEHKDEYVQMFHDCGWEYIQDMAGYSYFRKSVSEMNGTDESIFCDEDSRIDMMKRVWKGKVLPLLAIFFCLLGTLAVQRKHTVAFICTVILLVFYAVVLLQCGAAYWKVTSRQNKK